MIVTKNNTGEISGMVILNNFDQYPAPSISALSYNSVETFWIPPNKIMKLIPKCIHMVVNATENRAQLELVNQSTPLIPTNASILFNTPNDGWNRNKNIVAPAAMDTPIVDAKIVRKNPIPLIFSLASTARNNAIMISAGTVYKTNKNVATILFLNSDDCINFA